ncbi:hypothetical protein D8674_018112 [Pyrus ussuriensis x Pyrus communis]|uniref:Uncharacterized protein n=1 Tax=Pyrus ussuriensis x Pyrus communis TaxID=2448454 RepID=A0A5N5G961_9ROSA|nr:hypothetical protein D8674_018112 [Pyrus ussuriensis x Pyrus communis]
MKSTVRPQNAAKREAAEQEKTNHKPNPNKHRNGFSASMKIAHYIKEYGGLLNKGKSFCPKKREFICCLTGSV